MGVQSEIDRTARQILALYEQQRAYLESKPRQFVADLMHTSEENLRHEDFSKRTAAEINRTACMMVLEG